MNEFKLHLSFKKIESDLLVIEYFGAIIVNSFVSLISRVID